MISYGIKKESVSAHPNIKVFLLANANYYEKKLKLPFTINDIKIYNLIFTKYLKVPSRNIEIHENLTGFEFIEAFNFFIKKLEPTDLVFFIYTGHGNHNGLPKFVEGESIQANKFFTLFNKSFKNDTVIMMDSCYSGGVEQAVLEKDGNYYFRDNILRIYSSLALQKSEGRAYYKQNRFNKHFRQTYEFLNTYGYRKEKKNSLFTLLWASFFAEYDLESNVSFDTIYSHISSKISLMQQDKLVFQRPIMFPYNKKPFIKNYKLIDVYSKKPASKRNFLTKKYKVKEKTKKLEVIIKRIDKPEKQAEGIKLISENKKETINAIPQEKVVKPIKATLYKKPIKLEKKLNFEELNELAIQYRKSGDIDQSLKYYDKLKALAENNKNKEWLATAYHNMGFLYQIKKEYDNSLMHYQIALELRKSIFGAGHLITSISYNNIGALHYRMKHYKHAEAYLSRAVAIQKMYLNKNHPNLKASLMWLLKVYELQGNKKQQMKISKQIRKME